MIFTCSTTIEDPNFSHTRTTASFIFLQQRARRREAKKLFLKLKRKRDTTTVDAGVPPSRAFCPSVRHASALDRPHEEVVALKHGDNGNGNDERKPSPVVVYEAAVAPSATTATDESAPSSKKPQRAANRQPTSKKRGSARGGATDSSTNSRGGGAIRFSSVGAEGIIDMHTYHRGREGLELRGEDTGDLLCDVEPTDTAYGKDAPNLVANVNIEFPLEDEATDAKSVVRMYRETVPWDLGDSEAPTPMVYASSVAVKFGLSFTQTLELAELIQSQLLSWVRGHCGSSQPVILKDSAGLSREPPPSVAYSLYGDVTGAMNGGQPLSTVHVRKKPTIRAGTSARTCITTTSGAAAADTQIPQGTHKAPTMPRKGGKSSATVKLIAKYILEVRKRLREESRTKIKLCSATADHVPGEIVTSSNVYCHICQDIRDNGGTFACGKVAHTYCDTHLSELHNIATATEQTPMVLEYCPVCALECPCSSCTQRLDVVAQLLKAKAKEQGVSPAGTVFEDMFEVSHQEVLQVPAKASAAKKQKTGSPAQKVVSKIPYSDFPREVCNGIDLDPGTELDYRTVHSSAGTSLLTDAAGVSDLEKGECPGSSSTSPPLEDGSVDYCLVCGKHGNLLCCDFCPRAFHSDCIESNGADDRSDALWECPACVREKLGIPEEAMDGSNSLALVCKAHGAGDDSASFEDLTGLKILSIIHEMLGYLIKYNFGYAFKQPVDLVQVPAYSKIIEHPMDLGTISSSLEDGSYARRLGGSSLHATIVAVLNDIELVWHNCFTFNLPGSAIYRMAEVQRKAAQRIQSKSFDFLLSDEMKQEVQAFVAGCAGARDRPENSSVGEQAPPTSGQSCLPTKQRNKITVNQRSVVARSRRPVAVLDPDTGLVVKIYTSLQAACAAIEIFRSLKHECELDLDVSELYNKVRLLVRTSSKKPKCRLFGYRWLWLDELRSGKVSFPPQNVPLEHAPEESHPTSIDNVAVNCADNDNNLQVEIVQGGTTRLFGSIEESISQSGLSMSDAEELRSKLRSLAPNSGFLDFAGRLWRKLSTSNSPTIAGDGSVELALELSDQNLLTNGTNSFGARATGGSSVFKYDTIRGRVMSEFGSVSEAYSDWLMELATLSASSEHREAISLDAFQSLYLDGERAIGGVKWTTQVTPHIAASVVYR